MSRSTSDFTLPDLRGRTAVVTGASHGLGLEIARGLSGAGARVIMPVRDRGRGERATAQIRATVPGAQLELRDLDLAQLGTVDALVDELTAEQQPLHILVANAGIITYDDPLRRVSADGYEMHFQTNYLAHVALILGLLPVLREGRARVALQSSVTAAMYRMVWDDLQLERGYQAPRAYGQSKVALGLFGFELARRSATEDWGVTVAQGHPGISLYTGIAQGLREKAPGLAARIGNPVARGAQGVLCAATDPTPHTMWGPTGLLQLAGPARRRRPFRRTVDAVDAARLWGVTENLLARTPSLRRND